MKIIKSHSSHAINRQFFGIIFLFGLMAAGCNHQAVSPASGASTALTGNYNRQLQIGTQIVDVQVVQTPAAQQQGLSGRKSMDENQGMLFVFAQPASIPFWMKDMDFNLDLIWINNGKIIGITPDAPAPVSGESLSSLSLYYPPSPANEVLEVNSGWAKKNNISAGDIVVLK